MKTNHLLSVCYNNLVVKSDECNAWKISEHKLNNNSKQIDCFQTKCLLSDNNVCHLKEYTFLLI